MSRPEFPRCVMPAECIRHIRREQALYDEDPARYEENQRAMQELAEQEAQAAFEYEQQMEADAMAEHEASIAAEAEAQAEYESYPDAHE